MTDISSRHNDTLVMDLGTAHRELKPLLFEALSRLARQGFVVRPDDALDLIHDFLTHELDGLRRRYDAWKGGFKGYAYKAFIRFARPRIMRLQRFQNSLVDSETLDQISAPDLSDDLELSPDYQSKVTEAIASLPVNEASVLLTYINARVPSERLLAKSLGISRYETRRILLRALGRVVTQLPRPPGIANKDWEVAREIWLDHRTISETASDLNLTSHQVRLAQARVTKFLETSLRNVQRIRRHSRRIKMKGERYSIPVNELFMKALNAVGDKELLEELRSRADEVIASFGYSNESELIDESDGLDLTAEWLAEVYEALAGGVELPKEDGALIEAFFEASVKEEHSVGEAFQQVLWIDLPDHVHDLSRWFDDSARIDPKQMEELLDDPAVKGGFPESTLLLVYGITPMTIFQATEAVTSALERLQGYGFIGSDSSISLYPESAKASHDEQGRLSLDLLVAEIYTSARCPQSTARSLYSWLVEIARYKPFLFNTFEASVIGEGVQLQRRGAHTEDLFQRWRSRAESAKAKGFAAGASGGIPMAAAAATVPVYASQTPSPPNLMAVVMTSEDCSGEDYLKYGVTSGISRSLSLLPGLGVKQPEYVPIRCGQTQDVKLLQGLGRELGVKTVLAGWVEPEENRFRCHTQLVDTDVGEVWHGDYHRSYADLPRCEKDISLNVARHLGISIPTDWDARLDHSTTDDPEAQKLYMQGRYHWSKWSADGIQKALSCYNLATERVPSFSLAYAGKADCYNVLSDYTSRETPWSVIIKAKADAYEALEYGDSLPEAYASLAYAHTRYWKWDEAETEFQIALKLNPSYVLARKWYAIHLTALGRLNEALSQINLAEQYNPNSPIIMTTMGIIYYFARQYEHASEQFQKAISCNSALSFPHLGLGIVYAQMGRYGDAIDVLRQARSLFPENTKALAALGYVLANMGNEEEAREILAALVATAESQYVSPYSFALIHTALHDHDAALESLHNALEHKDPSLILLKVDPRFDEICENHGFQTIVAQIGV